MSTGYAESERGKEAEPDNCVGDEVLRWGVGFGLRGSFVERSRRAVAWMRGKSCIRVYERGVPTSG